MNEKEQLPCLCIFTRRAANAITNYYDDMMEEAGITLPQFSLMANLQMMGDASVSALAVKVKLDRTTLFRNLKPLIETGYIEVRTKVGKRNQSISLTEKGADRVAAAAPYWVQAQNDIAETIGDEKAVENFLDTLSKIEDLTQAKKMRSQNGGNTEKVSDTKN